MEENKKQPQSTSEQQTDQQEGRGTSNELC